MIFIDASGNPVTQVVISVTDASGNSVTGKNFYNIALKLIMIIGFHQIILEFFI